MLLPSKRRIWLNTQIYHGSQPSTSPSDSLSHGVFTLPFLREHLEKAGCVVGENFIKAVHCDKKMIRGS